MKKYLNISLMCYSYTANHFGAYGETVDTPVLGTGLARGESSNLSTPPSEATILELIAKLVLAISKICCDACCVANKMLQYRKGMYRFIASSRALVRLRNYQPNSYIPTTAYFLATPTCFF